MTRRFTMDLPFETPSAGDSFAVIQQARAGVERGKADEAARQIGLTDKGMARILNLSERTLHRLRPEALLDTVTGFGMVHTVLGRIEHGIYA